MPFKRMRRGLSTLATGSNNRKARAITQTTSVSGSRVISAPIRDPSPNDENSSANHQKHRRSITFDELFASDEARAGLALGPKHNSPSVSACCNEPAQGQLEGHKDRSVSASAAEKFPSIKATHLAATVTATAASPQASGSSSRRTTIFIGKPEELPIQNPEPPKANDEARRRAEHSYYEAVDQQGTTRRRSMLRSVSKDDYLLARGANPRTGIITPGVHSTNSPFEEVELFKQRGIKPPSKWRQMGDQWILGEQTPLSVPPKRPVVQQSGRPLRTSLRLTAGKYNQNIRNRTGYQKPSVPDAPSENFHTPDGVPGTYPRSPQRVSDDTRTSASSGPIIKRKPVGSPSKDSIDVAPPRQVTPQYSIDTVVKHPFVMQLRSSSAPASRAVNFECPDDVGKDIIWGHTSVPVQENAPRCTSRQYTDTKDSFLGRVQLGQADAVPESKTLVPSKLEKELPCLPMSSGQYQLQASTKESFDIFHNDTSRLRPSRGEDAAYPLLRNMRMAIPQRQYQIMPGMQTGSLNTSSMHPVPTCNSSPSNQGTSGGSIPTRGVIRGPRPMHQVRSVSENFRHANAKSTNAPSSTSMSTSIPTHISTLQPRLQRRSHKKALGFETDIQTKTALYSYNRVSPNDPRQWSKNVKESVPFIMPPNRQYPLSRPQMPHRADAHMRSVPRMSPQRNRESDSTDSRHQLKSIGTSEGVSSENNDVRAASTSKSNIDPRLLPDPLEVTSEGRDMRTHVTSKSDGSQKADRIDGMTIDTESGEDSSQSSGLTRKCICCHNGFVCGSLNSTVGDSLKSTSKQLREQEQTLRMDENLRGRTEDNHLRIYSKAVLGSESSENEDDERYHDACCAECCTNEDCHKGCLGHPSPSIRSFGGSTMIDSNEQSCALNQGSPSMRLTKSITTSRERSRPFFVQGLKMRKTLRNRHGLGDGKTIKKRYQWLDSPQIELDSHPLSSGSFWGGGEGAVNAAKRALGVNKRAATTPNVTRDGTSDTVSANPSANQAKRVTSGPNFVIPKIRDLRGCKNIEAGSQSVTEARSRLASEARNASLIGSAARSRNVSGASMLSIEIPHLFSSLGTINVASLLEMLRVPFEAAAMWIQTHPEARQWLWAAVEKMMNMGRFIVSTGGIAWEVSYIYSKTGRLRCRAPGGIGRLVIDCGRSVGYLLVFVAFGVCLARVLGFVLGMFQGLFRIVRAVGWLLKKLSLGLLC